MPRYALTSNLKEFPQDALVKASKIMLLLAESSDEDLLNSSELTISYNPETRNVLLTDSEFQIWVLDKYSVNLLYVSIVSV